MTQLTRFVLALCLSLLTASTAAAADKWTLVATDHFDVVGNTGDSDLRRMAQTLEHFHDVVVSAVLHDAGSSGDRAIVLVFKDDLSFTPYKPQGSGRSAIGGLFFFGDQTLLALNAEQLEYALRTVLNGYSRAVTARLSGQVPEWLSSGIGQVYETFEERNGGKGALIGRPDARLVEFLAKATLLPLPRLLTLDGSSPGMTPGTSARSLFDAQSWALVHYLSFGPRQAQLRQFLTAMRAGVPAQQASQEAFGDLAVLERELLEYVRKFMFPAMQIAFDEKVKPSLPPRGEVLNSADAEAYLSVLLRGSGYAAQARTRLDTALAATPASARATAALAQLEIEERKLERGLALYEKAATLAPKDERIQARLGHYLAFEVARKGQNATTDELEHARTVLRRALDLEPDDVEAGAELGWMLLFRPEDPAQAATLLTKAARLAPNRDEYRLWLADALLRQRKYDEMRALLGPLMARGGSPEIRTAARTLLGNISLMQRLDEARAAQAARPSEPASAAPAPAPALASSSVPADPSRTADSGPSMLQPALRRVESGETRVPGSFTAVTCTGGAIALVVQVEGRVLNLSTAQLTDVQFISYRQDAPAGVGCGPIRPAQRVLATYKPGPQPNATSAGVAVAIELLPDGYTPQ